MRGSVVWGLVVAGGAALVTGAVLAATYLPRRAGPWAIAHRWSGWVVVGLAVTWAVLLARRRRTSAGFAAGLGAVALVAGAIGGGGVGWDQVGLWAVTTGEGLEGVWFPWTSSDVRFVVVGGAEMAPDDYRSVVLLHVGLAAVAVVLVATSALLARRRPRPAAPPSAWTELY